MKLRNCFRILNGQRFTVLLLFPRLDNNNVAVIAGAVAGGCLLLILVILVIIMFKR